jgi:hypothetical protein
MGVAVVSDLMVEKEIQLSLLHPAQVAIGRLTSNLKIVAVNLEARTVAISNQALKSI